MSHGADRFCSGSLASVAGPLVLHQKAESVHRRLRRPAAALCAVLLIPSLAACSGDSDEAGDKESASASGSDAAGAEGELKEVTFTGDVGEAITAEWDSAVEAPDTTSITTLVKGEGDPIAAGDTVNTYLWVGNGTSKEQVYSDYDNGASEPIPNTDEVDDVFKALFKDATYGSRVVAVTKASEVFGEDVDESQTGVAATDSVVIVADLVEKQAVSPEPTDDKAHDAKPESQPKVVEKDGKPSGLDFTGIEEPALDTPVQRVVLKEGDGAALKATDTISVNYLGADVRRRRAVRRELLQREAAGVRR